MTNLASLAEIYIYPIKSLPGIKLEKALVTKYGIAYPENDKIIDRQVKENDLIQNRFIFISFIKPQKMDDNRQKWII